MEYFFFKLSKTIDRNVRGFAFTIIKGRLHIDTLSTYISMKLVKYPCHTLLTEHDFLHFIANVLWEKG